MPSNTSGYCNTVTVNGNSATIYYNGGSSGISLTSSTVTVQQLAIYYTSSYFVLSNISPFYA
jgi:hypothetical protein